MDITLILCVHCILHFIVVTWARVRPPGNGCTYQADHKCPCYNYYVTLPKANSLNANMSMITGFFIYVRLKGPIMVMQQ